VINSEALINTRIDNCYQSGVKLKSTLRGHESNIKKVIYNPDASRLASVAGKTIKIWDAESGACLRTLDEHKDEVSSIAYSPDGRSLASAGHKTVKIWDAESGTCLKNLRGHRGMVLAVLFTSDSQRLAGWSFDPGRLRRQVESFIQIWDVESGTYLRTLSGPNARVIRILDGKEFAYSPDGKQVAISIDRTIKIWNVETGACLRTLHGHNAAVSALAYSPDRKWLASGSRDKTIKIWEPESGDCNITMDEHKDGVASIAYSPDGKSLASGSDDHTIIVWEINNLESDPKLLPRLKVCEQLDLKYMTSTRQLLDSTGSGDLPRGEPDINLQRLGIGFGGENK
jgi:WD40 repeat protein